MKRILKNISTSAFALFAMLALSCTDDDFYPVETHRSDSTVRTSGDYSVTEKEAVDKAREALASFVNAGSTAKGLSRQSAREDQRPVVTSRSRHGDFYIVNFDGGGFALVSADNRATDIYAMSSTGTFDENAGDGVEYFMNSAAEYQNSEIENFKGDIEIVDTLGYVHPPTDLDDPRLGLATTWNGIPCYDKVKHYKYGVDFLLQTTWGQDYPYNARCPLIDGKSSLAGCVAIAMGQIMAYHKQPSSYNGHEYDWDAILEDDIVHPYSSGAESVSWLIADIGDLVSMDYGLSGSGAYSSECPGAFHKMGYTCGSLSDCSFSKVAGSLNNMQPVYMCGKNTVNSKGHAWVVDGYRIQYDTHAYYAADDLRLLDRTRTPEKNYVHCNWGWDGYCNGYYLYNALESSGYVDYDFNYSKNLQVITGITYNK